MREDQVYDIVCIGNYTKDTIVTPSGTSLVDGGAVNYAAQAVVRLGRRVAVVTHLAEEDQHVVESLRSSGVDCFPLYTSHSTCLRLEYPTADPDIRSLFVTATAAPITANEIEGLSMRAAMIGSSLRGEVGLDVIEALHRRSVLVGLDVQGYVRVVADGQLIYAPWEDIAATLACVDILKSDMVEARYLTGETDLYTAAEAYARMGPKEILLTHRDGLLIFAAGRFHELQFHARRLDGRSGRGDTCAGTYVAMRLSMPSREAGIWAAAVTSLKMEKPGPFRGSIQEVEDLIHSRYDGAVQRQKTDP